MPWTPKNFRSRHNKKLTDDQAKKASSIANAMIKSGADEGIAIATANKRVKHPSDKKMRKKLYGSE